MNRYNAKRLLTLLIILNLGFIWGNSLMNAVESEDLSGGVLAWIGQFFPFLLTDAGHNFLRKAAHFSEFCLLGALVSARRIAEAEEPKLTLSGFGLMVACIDETIQLYVPGRAGSLIDVWIDTAGFVTGTLLVMLGHSLIRKKDNYNH